MLRKHLFSFTNLQLQDQLSLIAVSSSWTLFLVFPQANFTIIDYVLCVRITRSLAKTQIIEPQYPEFMVQYVQGGAGNMFLANSQMMWTLLVLSVGEVKPLPEERVHSKTGPCQRKKCILNMVFISTESVTYIQKCVTCRH